MSDVTCILNRVQHGDPKAAEELLPLVDEPISQVDVAMKADDDTLLAVDDALSRLAEESPERAKLVKLRFFVGLSLDDAAEALGISESTAKRQWNYIRAWLFRELKESRKWISQLF